MWKSLELIKNLANETLIQLFQERNHIFLGNSKAERPFPLKTGWCCFVRKGKYLLINLAQGLASINFISWDSFSGRKEEGERRASIHGIPTTHSGSIFEFVLLSPVLYSHT